MNQQQARHFKSICKHLRAHLEPYVRQLKAFEDAGIKEVMEVHIMRADELFDNQYHQVLRECEQVLIDMRDDLWDMGD